MTSAGTKREQYQSVECLAQWSGRSLRPLHQYNILHLRGRKDAPAPLRLFRHFMALGVGKELVLLP